MFFARLLSPARARVAAAVTVVTLLVGAAACASGGRFQGMTAEVLHAYAQTEFDQGDYSDAAEAADRLLLVFPDYPQTAEVRFLLARAYYEDGRYLLASDEFQRFLQRYTGHLLGPEAAIGICRSEAAQSPIPQRDQTPTRRAETACRDVANQYRAHEVAAEADSIADEMRSKLAQKEYDIGYQYFRRSGFDSAIWHWAQLLEPYRDTPWAARALLGMACASEKIGYEDDAEEYRLQLFNQYPDSEAAREARANGQGC
jgi:outer membrane protein assembly factor BamD